MGWLLRFRANTAVVQSWIPRRSSETREKTVLFLGKHRVTPCRKQPAAVSCTPGTPRSHARPRLVAEPGVAMGLGAGAGSEPKAHPGPPDLLLCARTDLCRSPPMRRTGPPPQR